MIPRPPSSTLFPYTTLFRSMMYSGTYASQRYSTLSQINPSNVKNLEQKWIFQAESLEKFETTQDRKSTRLNSSHTVISYAVFCLKKKKKKKKKKIKINKKKM